MEAEEKKEGIRIRAGTAPRRLCVYCTNLGEICGSIIQNGVGVRDSFWHGKLRN